MKEGEKERQYQIKIINDAEWEPNEVFHVQLWTEGTKDEASKKIPGDDTECTVTILDEDTPGEIGFAERNISVKRKDKMVTVPLKRYKGSDGTVSCFISTINDAAIVPGNKAAVENVDFEPIKMQKIEFKANEVEQKIEIMMPDCEGDGENVDPEEADVVSFALKLSDPLPNGVDLNKKFICFISIEATDEAAE